MVLAAGQTVNEVYTFKDMLKQDDHVDFIKAMDGEIYLLMNRGNIGKLFQDLLCLLVQKQFKQFGLSSKLDLPSVY